MKLRIYPKRGPLLLRYCVQRRRWWGWQTLDYEYDLKSARELLSELESITSNEQPPDKPRA